MTDEDKCMLISDCADLLSLSVHNSIHSLMRRAGVLKSEPGACGNLHFGI